MIFSLTQVILIFFLGIFIGELIGLLVKRGDDGE